MASSPLYPDCEPRKVWNDGFRGGGKKTMMRWDKPTFLWLIWYLPNFLPNPCDDPDLGFFARILTGVLKHFLQMEDGLFDGVAGISKGSTSYVCFFVLTYRQEVAVDFG
jgi:hypothetical protein